MATKPDTAIEPNLNTAMEPNIHTDPVPNIPMLPWDMTRSKKKPITPEVCQLQRDGQVGEGLWI